MTGVRCDGWRASEGGGGMWETCRGIAISTLGGRLGWEGGWCEVPAATGTSTKEERRMLHQSLLHLTQLLQMSRNYFFMINL